MPERPTALPPPLVLVLGAEDLLARRAVGAVVDQIRAGGEETTVTRVEPEYQSGGLAGLTAPSLFGGHTVVVVDPLEEASDDLMEDLGRLLDEGGRPEVTLIVRHRSGARGKKIVESMKKQASVVETPAVKTDRDKADFVVAEFRAAQRRIDTDAVQAVVEAAGKDVAGLAAACAQLIADSEGDVDVDVVHTYHGGRVEVSGFRVADAVVAGRTAQAIALWRHAHDCGLDPVPLIAVLAMQFRAIAKVSGGGRGAPAGMAPWQADKARKAARHWDDDALTSAVTSLAEADHAVKGAGRDPGYAVERAIVEICRARGRPG